MNLSVTEFFCKLNSIPENEPLYNIIKSRAINLGKIKDKEEKKYWARLKRANKIPDIYLSNEELNINIKNKLNEIKKGDFKNGKQFN